MFEYLKGELTLKKLEYAVVDINGIGYKVNISLKTYDKLVLGEKTKLHLSLIHI